MMGRVVHLIQRACHGADSLIQVRLDQLRDLASDAGRQPPVNGILLGPGLHTYLALDDVFHWRGQERNQANARDSDV